MFLMNFTCKEFILNQQRFSLLKHFNKIFIASLSSFTKHNFNSADKNEFFRYEFSKCIEINDLLSTKQKTFESSFLVIPDIVSVDQESLLIDEIEKSMKRLRYQHDHWDDVINKHMNICFLLQ